MSVHGFAIHAEGVWAMLQSDWNWALSWRTRVGMPELDPQLAVLGRLVGIEVDRPEVGNPAVDDHRLGMHVGQRAGGGY